MKKIKAELWNVLVCDGAVAMVHGCYEPLKEYYIPKYNIAFNIYRDNLNVFNPDKDRYSAKENNSPVLLKEVEISESLAKSLKQYIELKKDLSKEVMEMIYNEEA